MNTLPRLLLVALAIALSLCAAPASSQHLFFRIVLGPDFKQPVSGRLLVFLEPGQGAQTIDTNPFRPQAVYVAAKEIQDLAPGSGIEIDTDDIAFPSGFSSLASGDYQVQALIDLHHSYNYDGREPGDPVSAVVPLTHFSPGSSPEPVITINETVPEPKSPISSESPEEQRAEAVHIREEDFLSPLLSRFWGRPIAMHALVVTPPDYDRSRTRYPVIYFTHGFGGSLRYLRGVARRMYQRMRQGELPPMIWILLDESSPTGTHEFADSANNGPWGQALTTEFIPYLESRYRTDRCACARFLTGHSSGGWATLWLQVTYPKIFGGTWSTAPDPSDFHDFTGVDLYAPHANVYRRPDGSPYPLVRMNGKVISTFEDFARLEAVLGPYGGQMASFEWVFSPKGPDGRPMQMFDRVTGDVDPNVVHAWEKYDIAHILETRWRELAPYLNGKIHVVVGTEDTFYLDGAARRLKAVLDSLHARAQVTFLEGKNHFNLLQIGDDRMALLDQMVKEMYRTWQASRANRPSNPIRSHSNHSPNYSQGHAANK